MQTTLEKNKYQIQMYGKTENELDEELQNSTCFNDPLFYAFCILSDVQECILIGQKETARKWINKAKYYISKARSK